MKKLFSAFALALTLSVPTVTVVPLAVGTAVAQEAQQVQPAGEAPAQPDNAVATKAKANKANTGLISRLAEFYQSGGWVMHFLAVTMALGWAITLERLYYLYVKAKADKHKILSQVSADIDAGRVEKAHAAVAKDASPLGKILAAGLERAKNGDRNYADAMDQASLANIPFLERNTPYLGMIGNVATLMGLLGTILGLISAFGATAYADPSQKAALLSLAISEAMKTSAFGLVVAIPALVSFSVLNGRTQRIIEDIQEASSVVIDKLNKRFEKA